MSTATVLSPALSHRRERKWSMRELKRKSIASLGPATVAPTSGFAAMMMACAAAGPATRKRQAASSGKTRKINRTASELEAHPHAEIGQAFIMRREIGIGNVVHVDADG